MLHGAVCSAIPRTAGLFNRIPVVYQCSNVTGPYQCNLVGSSSGTFPCVPGSGQAFSCTGVVESGQSITATSPVIDIRAYGAVADGTTDIEPAVCSAMQHYNPHAQGVSATLLFPCGGISQSCAWKTQLTPASCTGISGAFKIKLQGNLKAFTTFIPNYITEIDGEGQFGAQFQGSLSVGSIQGNPACFGTLGTAI